MTRTHEALALSAARRDGLLQATENWRKDRDARRLAAVLTVRVSDADYLRALEADGDYWTAPTLRTVLGGRRSVRP